MAGILCLFICWIRISFNAGWWVCRMEYFGKYHWTAIAEAVDMLYNGKSKQHDNFLVERYLEDGGYCSVVRGHVTEQLPSGMNYFDVKETRGLSVIR